MGTWQDIFDKKIGDMNVTERWTIQEDDDLQVHALGPGWKEFVQRRALGRFQCSQCLHRWSSAKVHILFHMCRSQGWGTVRMRTFRQMCSRCTEPRLEKPEFSEETMETLLHNLVLKILKYFYHVLIQPSELMEVVVDVPVQGPHDSAHCEACQLGVCSQMKKTPDIQVLDDRKPLKKKKQTPGIQVLDDRKPLKEKKQTPGIQVLDDRKPLKEKKQTAGIQVLDDREPLMEKKKTRTHHILNSTHAWPNATQTHHPQTWPNATQTHHPQTRPNATQAHYSHTWPNATQTHQLLSVCRNCPCQTCCCCWNSAWVLCVMLALLFIWLYFTRG